MQHSLIAGTYPDAIPVEDNDIHCQSITLWQGLLVSCIIHSHNSVHHLHILQRTYAKERLHNSMPRVTQRNFCIFPSLE